MKRIIGLALILVMMTAFCGGFGSFAAGKTKLYVYNWGEYISDGTEESEDVIKNFEKYYEVTFGEKIEVVYSTFNSNEEMYTKISNDTAHYDVIIPSDYMIARLIEEDRLAKLDYSNIPNIQYIQEDFKGKNVGGTGVNSDYYDPTYEYSVPYMYGMIGVIYNTKKVPASEENIGSWNLMWDEDYKGNILQFNNSRDAFGTAFYKLGWYDKVNDATEEEWNKAKEELLAQKKIVQGWVMDEIYDKMKSGSAAVSAYYAGDFLTMYEDNEDLEFFYPKEGTNFYVDAMCVPKESTNKLAAERFINYMLSAEAAIPNAEYTYYACPNSLVYDNEEYKEYMNSIKENAMDIIYGQFDSVPTSAYENLSNEQKKLLNDLWEDVKIKNAVSPVLIGGIVIAVAAVVVLAVLMVVKKKKRNSY